MKELREEKNLLQRDLARYLNISTSAYGYYEQGKRKPDIETTKKIADFFDVSTDYLLGRTDNKKNYIKSTNFYSKIENRIAKRLSNEGIIMEGEPIPENVLEKILKYGVDATIEILKPERN